MINSEKMIKILDRITEMSILAIIFLVPLYFAYFKENYNIFELNKVIIFRLFLLIGLSAFIAKVAVSGNVKFRFKPIFLWSVLLLLATYLLASIFSIAPQRSIWGDYFRQQGFYSQAAYIGFFMLLIFQLQNWQQLRRIMFAVFGSACIVSLYGLIQAAGLDFLKWTEPAFLSGRIFSSLGQPNLLGQYLILVLPVSVFLFCYASKNLIIRTCILVGIVMQIFCLYFTFSRAAWVGFIVSAMVWILVYLAIKRYWKMIGVLAGFGTGLLILLILLNIFSKPVKLEAVTFGEKIKSVAYISSNSTNIMRLEYWRASLKELRQASRTRWLVGYGPETISKVMEKYYRPDWGVYERVNTLPDRTHNLFFDQLLQFGLLGLGAFLFFVSVLVKQLFSYIKKNAFQTANDDRIRLLNFLAASLAAYFAVSLFSFSLTTHQVYFYLLVGLMVFIISAKQEERIINFNWLKEDTRIVIAVLFFLVFVIFFYLEDGKSYLADYYLMKAAKAERAQECQILITDLFLMAGNNPGRDFYYDRFGYLGAPCIKKIQSEGGKKDFADKIAAQLNQIQPSEYTFETEHALARAYSELSVTADSIYSERAEKIYVKLLDINREIPLNYFEFGRHLYEHNNNELARETLFSGLKVTPSLNDERAGNQHRIEIGAELVKFYDVLASSFLTDKKNVETEVYYQRALMIDPFNSVIHKKVGDLYYSEKKYDRAIYHYNKGLVLNPLDHIWLIFLSVAYKDMGNLQKAFEYATQAQLAAPQDDVVRQLMSDLENVKK